MTIARFARRAATIAAFAALAACQVAAPYRPEPVAPRQTGFEGNWLSTDGVAMSTLNGGQFTTRARDTGSTLATGSYRNIDGRTITIQVTSLIRQTTSNVNCALINPTQLNCTSSTGQQFTLVRAPASV